MMYKLRLLKLVFTGQISFSYWLKHRTNHSVWIYTDELINEFNEYHAVEKYDLKLTGKNRYKLADGRILFLTEQKSIMLYKNNQFIRCSISENGKLIPYESEQIVLQLPVNQATNLRKLATNKNMSLNDFLLQQINSVI